MIMRHMPRVSSVTSLGDYRLHLEFDDGVGGDIDLGGEVSAWAGVLSPLRDRAFFAQVALDDELGTIIWPNGVDLAPEALYDDVVAPPETARLSCLVTADKPLGMP